MSRAHTASSLQRITETFSSGTSLEHMEYPEPGSMLFRVLKRLTDITFSATAMLLLAPVFLVLFLLIAYTGGSPFFLHRRIGRNGKTFDCIKFRTMAPDAEQILAEYLAQNPLIRKEWETHHKLKNDPRITRVGQVLRQTSLDELPQLWNVLLGDMSLVGPRPVIIDELEKYGNYLPYYLSVRPGLTGLWQVSGRNDVGYAERVMMDVHYVKNRGFFNDLLLMLRTFRVLFSRRGAY